MDKVQPSKLRSFKDLLKCAICFDIFTDPKILSCHHFFCAECIEKHHASSQEGNLAHCPICRQGFVLDLSGASSLPSCYFINDMLENFSKEHFEEKKEIDLERLCEALCLKSEKRVSAVYACPPCGLDLCQDCSEAHQVFFSHHEIVDVKDYQRPAMVQTLELEEESLKCSHHKEYNLNNFCTDCQAVLCQICKLKHKDHACISIESIKTNTLELREKLARIKDDIERKKRDIQTFKIILTTSEAKALNKLRSTHKQLHEKIDLQKTYMENQLKTYSSHLQGEITKTLEDVDVHSKSIESILELIHTLYAFGNDRCLLMYWQNIKDRSESINVDDLIPSQLESKDAIKFDAIAVDTVNIGELTFSSPDTNCFGMFDTKLEEDGLPLKQTTEEIYDDGIF
ncbi:E3 ubiquitin-protein ligase TRIM56-like [Saccostrea cucullata]|uniref:E3 ubiquitin-protein ligase TRIM56-like n=1 Tax=Saccostrea cuccullata TaxID=36930 RepID=UPI002ED05E9B